MLRFWNRLVKMPHDRLTKQIFLAEYASRYHNWTKEIRNIFRMTNQMNIYEQKRLCNMEMSSNRLMENNEDEWKTTLYTKPKLSTYVTFKSKLETETISALSITDLTDP